MNEHSNKNKYYRKTAIAFIVLLSVLVGLNVLIEDKDFSKKENRVLAKYPIFTISEGVSGRYKESFEKYTNDQFLLRPSWTNIKITTDMLMGKNLSNGVYRGEDGYLIQKFQKPKEKIKIETLNALKDFKKENKKIKMNFLIAPTSSSINKERLPSNAINDDENQYIDYMYSSLKKEGIETIDVRENLLKHKNEQLYYHSDHHWTTKGAYYAYEAAAPKLKIKFDKDEFTPGVVDTDFRGVLQSKSGYYSCKNDDVCIYFPNKKAPKSVVTYVEERQKSTSFYKGENLEKNDAYTVFFGGNHSKMIIETAVKSDKTLLVLKDSYANSFIPFLASKYHRIVVVDPRYYFESVKDIIKIENITDTLFLYNANTLSEDTSLSILLSD